MKDVQRKYARIVKVPKGKHKGKTKIQRKCETNIRENEEDEERNTKEVQREHKGSTKINEGKTKEV